MFSASRLHSDTVLEQWKAFENLIASGPTEISLDGLHLSIPQVIYVARYGGRLRIDPSTRPAMMASRDAVRNELERGGVIYGINTGFGASADLRTTQLERLQHTLTRELSYGILQAGHRDHNFKQLPESIARYGYNLSSESSLESKHLPRSWVRAAILIRINTLIKGNSAVRPVITERMQDLLHHEIIPMIPLRGSISASGDLSPLAYISGAIQGKPTIRILSPTPEDIYADLSLQKATLAPITLEAKEGLAIVNGTAISTAAGVVALYDAHGLAILCQVITAMSVEAMLGTTESFHPFFGESRPHIGQIESAENILSFLEGSKLAQINDGADGYLRQDRYSIRTAAQWIGPALEDLQLAHQQIVTECNSTTDNPIVDNKGRSLHGGNFQAKSVTAAMEKTRQAMQTIGRMMFTQCVEIINPATSRGLPPNLVAEDPSVSGIFKATDIHISALQAELGFLANPVNHVQTAELGNQALNSLALISARYTYQSIDVLSEMAAAHLLAVCQALDLRAMHVQFLHMYRPRFSATIRHLFHDFPLSNARNDAEINDIEESLWKHLLGSFDTTVSMDAMERFTSIAKSMRTPFIDHPIFTSIANPFIAVESFIENLAPALRDSWCAHRDAYLLHGDASACLGTASKRVYNFIRGSLGIPFLCTSCIRTPNAETRDDEEQSAGSQAPTVGSYTSVLYRALRDGTCMKVVMGILEAVPRPANPLP